MAKVFVGMSGGVDSSVAAALLLESGYDVTGVYMKNWSQDLPGTHCPWAEDLADAKRVAVDLGIDLKVYDFQTEYKQKVVDYLVNEYQLGRTPNPDIMCNQEIKFKLFLETALNDGADLIATGHYAKVEKHLNSGLDQSQNKLLRSKDQKKDQTYFLYRISSSALGKTLFPLGDFEKTEIRQIAKQKNLITANKKDSQGICFVGQVGIEEFLSQYVDAKPGKIIEQETGRFLGWHKGAIFYTVGQRHGLDVGGGLPYYVVSKDINQNQVVVSKNLNQSELWTRRIKLRDLHWINGPARVGDEYLIRIRHQAPLIMARITKLDEQSAELEANEDLRAVTNGQSVVIYDNQVCLGGGFVD